MKNIPYIFNISIMLCLLFTSPANASVVYSGLINLEGPDFNIDINNDGVIDFSTEWRQWAIGNGTSWSGFDTIVNFNIHFIHRRYDEFDPLSETEAPLNYGDTIKSTELMYAFSMEPMIWHKSEMFNEPYNTYSGMWHNISNKYLGFELTVGSESFYGWIRINTDTIGNVIVVDFAYENIPFTPIKAGFEYTFSNPGDVNADEIVDLTDLIICCKVLAGIVPASTVSITGDVNQDNKIGTEEMIFILQTVVDVR